MSLVRNQPRPLSRSLACVGRRRCALTYRPVGFHGQQAVEKALKAVVAVHDRAYPWTHDLRHLMELLDDAASPRPAELSDARRLTPWAAEFRYGETIDDELDRPATVHMTR
jgi:HEPN domain-containing protein